MNEQTVFIIDDDAAVRDSIQELVESVGLSAKSYESAQIFLDSFQEEWSGCLVINAEAREHDDHEQQARFSAAVARMPCLLLTDRGDVNMAVYGLKAGASDIVQKPYRNHNLLNSIKQMLGITAADTSMGV